MNEDITTLIEHDRQHPGEWLVFENPDGSPSPWDPGFLMWQVIQGQVAVTLTKPDDLGSPAAYRLTDHGRETLAKERVE